MAFFRNSVMIAGKGYNLKTSATKTGKTAASFSLLVVEKIKKDEDTKTFFWIKCYSGLADNIVKYWEEGKDFFIEGRIDSYKDKDGVDKYSIVASEIKFV